MESTLSGVRRQLAIRTRPWRRRLRPRNYKEHYVQKLLDRYSSPTYFEIGVRHGDSFRWVDAGRKIGVDPVRQPEMGTPLAGEEFYEATSDDFFAKLAGDVLRTRCIDVALIDGLHEFSQVVRDFHNVEQYISPKGVVVLDDFNPRSAELASDVPTGAAWNGDVWKLAPYLRSIRPDLRLRTVDADQGVGIVDGFGDEPTAADHRVVDECKALDYSYLRDNRRDLLGLISPDEFDAGRVP